MSLTEGKCAICGAFGPLTEEHIPPRAAFNKCTVLEQKMGREGWDAQFSDARRRQGGLRRPSLCAPCNNNTGSWYAGAYVYFALQSAHVPSPATANETATYFVDGFFPMRVVKQVLAMMCTVCGPGLASRHPELTHIILGKYNQVLPPPLRLYGYLKCSPMGRHAGMSAVIRVDQRKSYKVAEFSWWPFGWVLSYDYISEHVLTEVTDWLRWDYRTARSTSVRFPIYHNVTPFPLDYRTPEQVAREADATGLE